MRRRSVLRGSGLALAGGLAGCSTSLPFLGGGVSPVWERGYPAVEKVTHFQGWVYVLAYDAPSTVVAVDPSDGTIQHRCGTCWDFHGGEEMLFVETRAPQETVTAYSFPINPEWQSPGRFLARDEDTVYVYHEAVSPLGNREYRLRAVDRSSGADQWVYPLDVDHPGIVSLAKGEGMYAVVGGRDQSPMTVINLDAGTGDSEWVTEIGPGRLPHPVVGSDVVVVGSEGIVGDVQPTVSAVDTSGRLLWQQRMDAFHAYPEWVGDGIVLVSLGSTTPYQPRVKALGIADGREQWSVAGRLVGVWDGRAHVYTGDHVVGYAVPGGTEVARVDLSATIGDADYDAVGIDRVGDRLYVTVNQRLAVLDWETGSPQWGYTAGEPIHQVHRTGERVYVSTGETLVALPRPEG